MRKRSFYPKLAAQNMKNNRQFYIPYLLATIGTTAAFYILAAIVNDPGADRLGEGTSNGQAYVSMFMVLGMFVVGLFSCIFLLYTNSFLIKRRKKELGLYNVLGMGKGNIGTIMVFESFYTILIGIGGGIGVGILLHKLVTLALHKIMRFEVHFGFTISVEAIVMTVVVFTGFLLLTLVSNLISIRRSKTVDLLSGGNVGEREPKTRWLMTIIGIVALGIGYWLAITVSDGASAIGLYFMAVFAVIIGTYCLFTAVSIFVLKALRKNKRFYYKTNNFIGISGMIYRMKRNAVGLANICILATMVMVMISGTLSMYLGVEETLEKSYPKNTVATTRFKLTDEERFKPEAMMDMLRGMIEEYGYEIKSEDYVTYFDLTVALEPDGKLVEGSPASKKGKYINVSMSTAADYARTSGTQPVELAADEVLIYGNWGKTEGSLEVDFDGNPISFNIAGVLDGEPGYGHSQLATTAKCYLIFSDESVLDEMYIKSGSNGYMRCESRFDLDCTEAEQLDFLEKFWANDRVFEGTGDWEMLSLSVRAEEETELYGFAGGFLFLGIFLGIVFLMATALIIYYKQISEGYEDQRRFEIMRQVGLSEREIKRSVRSQVLMVFFLPIVVAAIHIAFDFNMVIKLLTLFSLTNVKLTAICTLATVLAFSAVYAVMYVMTAKAYYKIVKK